MNAPYMRKAAAMKRKGMRGTRRMSKGGLNISKNTKSPQGNMPLATGPIDAKPRGNKWYMTRGQTYLRP
jgi:hypothetical protein